MNRRVVLWRQRIEHFIFKMFGMFACMNELMMPPKQRRGRGRIGRSIWVHYVLSFQRCGETWEVVITMYAVACRWMWGFGCMAWISTKFREAKCVSLGRPHTAVYWHASFWQSNYTILFLSSSTIRIIYMYPRTRVFGSCITCIDTIVHHHTDVQPNQMHTMHTMHMYTYAYTNAQMHFYICC